MDRNWNSLKHCELQHDELQHDELQIDGFIININLFGLIKSRGRQSSAPALLLLYWQQSQTSQLCLITQSNLRMHTSSTWKEIPLPFTVCNSLPLGVSQHFRTFNFKMSKNWNAFCVKTCSAFCVKTSLQLPCNCAKFWKMIPFDTLCHAFWQLKQLTRKLT